MCYYSDCYTDRKLSDLIEGTFKCAALSNSHYVLLNLNGTITAIGDNTKDQIGFCERDDYLNPHTFNPPEPIDWICCTEQETIYLTQAKRVIPSQKESQENFFKNYQNSIFTSISTSSNAVFLLQINQVLIFRENFSKLQIINTPEAFTEIESGDEFIFGITGTSQVFFCDLVSNNPTFVPFFENVKCMKSSKTHAGFIFEDGSVTLWGKNNNFFQLGSGEGISSKHIEGNFKDIALGEHFTLLLTENSEVLVCGNNRSKHLPESRELIIEDFKKLNLSTQTPITGVAAGPSVSFFFIKGFPIQKKTVKSNFVFDEFCCGDVLVGDTASFPDGKNATVDSIFGLSVFSNGAYFNEFKFLSRPGYDPQRIQCEDGIERTVDGGPVLKRFLFEKGMVLENKGKEKHVIVGFGDNSVWAQKDSGKCVPIPNTFVKFFREFSIVFAPSGIPISNGVYALDKELYMKKDSKIFKVIGKFGTYLKLSNGEFTPEHSISVLQNCRGFYEGDTIKMENVVYFVREVKNNEITMEDFSGKVVTVKENDNVTMTLVKSKIPERYIQIDGESYCVSNDDIGKMGIGEFGVGMLIGIKDGKMFMRTDDGKIKSSEKFKSLLIGKSSSDFIIGEIVSINNKMFALRGLHEDDPRYAYVSDLETGETLSLFLKNAYLKPKPEHSISINNFIPVLLKSEN